VLQLAQLLKHVKQRRESVGAAEGALKQAELSLIDTVRYVGHLSHLMPNLLFVTKKIVNLRMKKDKVLERD